MPGRKNRAQLYQSVFNTPQGRECLEDLCKQFTLLRNRVDSAKSVDVNRLLIMEGERNVLLYICQLLGKDPLEQQPTHAKGE